MAPPPSRGGFTFGGRAPVKVANSDDEDSDFELWSEDEKAKVTILEISSFSPPPSLNI